MGTVPSSVLPAPNKAPTTWGYVAPSATGTERGQELTPGISWDKLNPKAPRQMLVLSELSTPGVICKTSSRTDVAHRNSPTAKAPARL